MIIFLFELTWTRYALPLLDVPHMGEFVMVRGKLSLERSIDGEKWHSKSQARTVTESGMESSMNHDSLQKHLFLPLISNQLHSSHLSAASPEQWTVKDIDLESWMRIMKICTHHRFLNVNVLLLRFSPWPAHSSPHSGSSSWHHLRFNDSSTETLSSTLLLFGSALEEEKIGGSSVLNNINGQTFASIFDYLKKRRERWTDLCLRLRFHCVASLQLGSVQCSTWLYPCSRPQSPEHIRFNKSCMHTSASWTMCVC